MKPYYLHDIRTYSEPYGKELQEIAFITQQHSVVFDDGLSGFIFGDIVIAPFYKRGDCIVQKDGHAVVLTFQGTNRFGVTLYKLPFSIPVENLAFRHEKVTKDTFLFRACENITLCRAFSMLKLEGRFEITHASHFCPVFDRHAHLIGINVGVFNNERICIPIQLLL